MTDGAELATAWVKLVPSLDGVTGAVTDALGGPEMDKAGQKAGKRMSAGMKTALLAGGALAVAGLVSVFNTGLEELKFGEQINAQTDTLIANTGFAMATSEINDYTLALSQISGVSEEELQDAGNNLLKFGGLSEDAYKRAVASINDIASTGKEAAGVAGGLGKALADPAAAAGVLRRQGIALTEQQQELIDSFVEAGDTAGAQGVILDALEGTYGGMAEATGGTLEGNLNKLNNAFENMAGDIVSMAMPAIEGLVGMLQGLVGWLSENQGVIIGVAALIGVTLVAAFIAWAASVWASTIALLANPITWIILGIIALIAAIVLLVMNWDTVVAWITEVWAGFIGWITGVIDGFIGWWNGVWAGFASWIGGVWAGFVGWISGIWSGFIGWIMGVAIGFVGWWNGLWAGVGAFISSVWSAFVSGIQRIWNGYWGWVTGAIGGFGRWLSDTWSGIWNGLAGVVRGVWNNVIGFIQSGINGAIGLINGMISGVNAIGGAIGIELSMIPIVSLPRLAKGATVLPRPGGTAAILAEAGRPESVVDTGLMNRALEEGLGSSGPRVVVLRVGDREFEAYMEEVADGRVGVYDTAQRQASRRGYAGGY